MKKITHIIACILLVLFASGMKAQISGVVTVPGTYTSLAAAINDLNIYGVSGAVTINVAAGYTETAIAGGYSLNVILGSSATNQVTFQKSGAGANPIIYAATGGTGTPATAIQDGIWRFIGTDWVTVNGIDLNDPNAANPATMEFGYGFFKASTTDGCNNNTIKNCTITLNRINNVGGSGPAVDGSRGIDVVNALPQTHTSAVTITSINGANSNNKFYSNTIQNCNYGISMIGYSDSSPFNNGDMGNDIGGSSAATGNTIINFGGGGTSSAAAGVRTGAQYNLNVSYNVINSNNGSGVDHGAALRGVIVGSATSATTSINNNTISLRTGTASTSAMTGIDNSSGSTAANNAININNNLIVNCLYGSATSGSFNGVLTSGSSASVSVSNNTFSNNVVNGTTSTGGFINNSGAATSAININNNIGNGFAFANANSGSFNFVYMTGGATTATFNMNGNSMSNMTNSVAASGSYVYLHNDKVTAFQSISNNTFNNLNVNTTGSIVFIENSVSQTAGSIQNINTNSIVTGFTKAAGGTVTFYTSTASSVAGATLNAIGNNFSNITLTGATTMAGWVNTDGGAPTKVFNSNVFTNWNCGTSAVTAVNINRFGNNSTVNSNTISAITASAAISGITYGAAATSTFCTVAGNVVTGLNSTAGAVTGISIGGSTSSTLNVNNNVIGNLASTGALVGLSVAGTANNNVFKNKIYDLTANGSAGTTNGLTISGGSPSNVYNNVIGDLKAPATVGANAITGISVTGGTTDNIYFNTVLLNATSTGSLFGSSAISMNASPTTIDLRNNIFVNNSTATGTGVTVASLRSSTVLTNYATTSNNNLFYAGTPGSANLIFSDGTNFSQTLAAYKTLMVNRDAASVTENPTFISTTGTNANFLNISAAVATQIESGALPIAGITDDYAGTVRNAGFPDIGAFESNLIAVVVTDVTAPTIGASGFTTSACNLSARTLTVSLSDLSGIATGGNAPRVYYKVNAGAFTSVSGTLSSGTATVGVWSFNLAFTAVPGDLISYYVVAQDVAATPNLAASPSAGFSGTNVNSVTTPPTTPSTFNVSGTLNGPYTVGAAGTFTSLTAAANAYNTWCLTGAVTFSLVDALYSTNETYPIVFQNNVAASSTNSLLIRPATGVTVALTPSTNTAIAVLKFLDARYITVDGINAGGSALNINNTYTSTAAASANIWLASSNTTGSGNNFIAVKNSNLNGGSNQSSNAFIGGVNSASPSTTAGQDNDNITITGNTILNMYNGVLSVGTASISNGGMDNWVISNNTFGPAALSTGSLAGSGIGLQGIVGATISANMLQNIVGTSNGIGVSTGANISASNNTMQACALANGVVFSTISSCSVIANVIQNSTLTTAANHGIDLNTAITGFAVSQNTVNNVIFNGVSTTATSMISAIYCGSSVINGVINANYISGINQPSTAGFGIRGIMLNSTSTSSISVTNNFISDVYSYGDPTAKYFPMGIALEGSTGAVNIDFNSINLFGSRTGLSGATGSTPLYFNSSGGSVNVRNNNLVNTYDNPTSTTDINYAIYSAVALSNFGIINNNNYYVGGTGNVPTLGYIGSARTTLAALQTGFGQNLNSQNALPVFVSNTDLHLTAAGAGNAYLESAAIPVLGVTTDYDAQTRNVTTPDIGADEFVSSLPVITCTAAVAGTAATTAYTLCSNQNQAITVGGATTGNGITYQWQVSNTAGGSYTSVPSATTLAFTTPTVGAGVYYYTLKTTCAAATLTGVSNEVTVTVNGAPTPSFVASPSVICNAGGSTTLTASGATSYTWSTGATGSSVVITPTASGVYNVTGSVAACAASVSPNFTLYVSSNPTINIAGSTGICTGQTATLTASGATTYSWNTGATTNSITDAPTITTTYTVTGTGPRGCSTTTTQVVNVAASLNIQITGPNGACPSQTTLLTASGGVTYTWSSNAGSVTTATIAPSITTATTYTVIGASGTCSNTAVKTLTINPTPTLAVSGVSVICVGQTTTLSASGASTYAWAGPNATISANTATATLAPTTTTVYTVTGTSSLGCSIALNYSVNVNAVPVLTVAQSPTAVCVANAVTLTATGATGTYTWTSGPTSSVNPIASAAAGAVYTVTGANTTGCSSTQQFTLNTINLPTISVSPASPTICSTATVNLTASGAGTSGTYTWTGGPTTNTYVVSPANSTTYTVVGTTSAGCVSSKTVAVTTNTLPVLVLTPATQTICSQSAAVFSVSGTTSYSWSTLSTAPSITVFPVNNTTYTVTGTNAAGCSSSATVAATTLSLPVISVAPSLPTVCVNAPTTFTASGATTYTWATGVATGSTAVITSTGLSSYSVSGTGPNNCVASAQFIVFTNPLPVLGVSASAETVCATTPVSFTASGANTYSWSNGGSTNSSVTFSPASSSVYTVTGTNTVTGCVGTQTVAVATNSLPVVTITPASPSVCAHSSLMLSASGASTYVWSNTSINNNITVIATTTANLSYTVTGTDAIGCSNTQTVMVTVNALPVLVAPASLSMCVGEVATLTVTGANTYTWNGTTTGGSYTVSPSLSSVYVYTVSGTDNNNCVNKTTVALNVSDCLGIKANSFSGNLVSVYPNPSTGAFTAKFDFAGEKTVMIMDVAGKVISQSVTNSTSQEFNLSEMAKGVYFVKISTKDASGNYKLIIE